jgi:hypothetical protein
MGQNSSVLKRKYAVEGVKKNGVSKVRSGVVVA